MTTVDSINAELGTVKGAMQNMSNSHIAETASLKAKAEMLERMLGETQKKNAEEEEKKKKKGSLMIAKDMKPERMIKEEQWRNWREEVQDYCEEVIVGMKGLMVKVRKMQEEVTENEVGEEWWELRKTLYNLLKKFTGDDPKKVVMGVRGDNGWEAWRMLQESCEPSVGMKEADVLAQYTNMVTKRSKSIKETKAKLTELEQRAKRVEEVTEKPVDERHARSILVGIVDKESLKHTVQDQKEGTTVAELKRRIQEFVNMMDNTDNKTEGEVNRFERGRRTDQEKVAVKEAEERKGKAERRKTTTTTTTRNSATTTTTMDWKG